MNTKEKELKEMENSSIARVLYLEDDEDTVEMVKFTLNLSNIEVVVVSSSNEVARLAKSESFDLFLLDGLLPTGDSFDLCKELRASNPETPVVFYSALSFPKDIQKGVQSGADAYLVKPYSGDLAAALLQTMARTEAAVAGQGQ